MSPFPLPTISLPSLHEPEWVTPYNGSEYHIACDEEHWNFLRVKLLLAPSSSSAAASKGMDQIQSMLGSRWYEVQKHPHIAQAGFATISNLLDPRTNAPTVALVMPYYERKDFLEACRNATMTEKINWLAQVCEAVQYLHKKHVFHGNIHFRNIMIAGDGSACLTDAGLYYLVVRHLGDLPQVPKTIACKTARAARLLSADGEILPPSMEDDIFALAVTIFTVFNGAEPWATRNAVNIISEYGHRELVQPEGMSDGLWNLLHGLFCQDQRPIPSARKIGKELLLSLGNPAGQGLFPRMLRAFRD